MDNNILYTAKFTNHDLKFHKVWWKSDKRCGSWSGQTDRIPIYTSPNYVCGGYNYEPKPVMAHLLMLLIVFKESKQSLFPYYIFIKIIWL